MPRKRTGNVIWETDHFVARVLLDDGKYGRIQLPSGLSEAKAKEHAAFYSENLDKALDKIQAQKNQKAGVALIPMGETFTAYLDRWYADRDKRGMAAIKGDRRVVEMYVCPHIGEKPTTAITREDIEKLIQYFDERTARGEWAWRSARRAWNIIRKLFSDMCKSKNLALRVRKDNPTNDIAPPDRGEEKAKAFLWPNEFLQLVTCERIPLALRRLYAIAIYLYSRSSEILVLRWTEVDMDHGTIKISRSYDHERKREKSTKAGRVRMFAIEANLLPLLHVMHTERKDDGRIFAGVTFNDLAERFREHLREAGIIRSDLFVSDDQHMAIRFHDTRATGITWMAMRGDDTTTIMERVGHKEFATTQLYLRRADVLRGRIGQPFPELPACLLDPDGSGDDGGSKLSGKLSTTRGKFSALPSFQGVSMLTPKVPGTFGEVGSTGNVSCTSPKCQLPTTYESSFANASRTSRRVMAMGAMARASAATGALA